MALAAQIPVGVVLEGGYSQRVLAECVCATLPALPARLGSRRWPARLGSRRWPARLGEPALAGEAREPAGAPEPLYGPASIAARAIAQVGRYWPL